jgi:hypothetical protein
VGSVGDKGALRQFFPPEYYLRIGAWGGLVVKALRY